MNHQNIELGRLKASPTNPRKTFEPNVITELAQSIKKLGVIQPIIVRQKSGGFEIVAGERRYRAAKEAGLKEIPAIVRELSDEAVIEIQVVENLQRQDLHPLEEAESYRQLMRLPKPHQYDAAKIADRIGRSVKYVYDRIKLLDLTAELQKDFRDERITAGHAILLARLTDKDQKMIRARHLYVSDGAYFKEIVGNTGREKPVSVKELEQNIREHVRFVAQRDADPMLFPETAMLLKSADPKKKSDKIVPLATGYVQDSARAPEGHISPASWKRADGKQGSKTCDLSVIGVIIAGEERAKAFRVCTAKDKCKVHWAERIKARAQRNGMVGVKTEGMSQAEIQRKEKENREAEEKRKKEVERCWNLALPKVLQAVAARFKKAPAGSLSALAEILKDLLDENVSYRHYAKKVEQLVPIGKTAEDLVRHLAFYAVYEMADNSWEREAFIKHAKFFGVDVKKILDQAAVQTSAQAGGAK